MNKGMRAVASGAVLIKATLEDNLRKIAELGYKEADILLISGWAHVGLDELADNYSSVARRIENALSATGIGVSSFNTKYSVPLEDGNAAGQRQRELEALVRLMGDLGVERATIQPTLTGDIGYLEQAFAPTISESFRHQVYAGERGFQISLEPHVRSCICTNEAINRAWETYPDLCITADPSHLLHSGDPMESLGYLFEQATMVHLRDASPGKLFEFYQKGVLDLDFSIGMLKKAGYSGPIALEYLSDEPDSEIYEDLAKFRQAVDLRIAGP
ncbi:MAG: sugar phosphate isomerase/epimerase [Oscillospiraceae bacterium]|nr:sugar phosphate isomerase/epimerase [Oscillospiraceae bacterium]